MQYNQAVATLLDRIPEFKNSNEFKDSYPDIPYMVWGSFALFLKRIFPQRHESSVAGLLNRTVSLFDDMARAGDQRILNLLGAGTLEVLTDDAELRRYLRANLSEQTVQAFTELLAEPE